MPGWVADLRFAVRAGTRAALPSGPSLWYVVWYVV